MTTTTSGSRPAALARAFLTGGVAGVSLAALVVGVIVGSLPLCALGAGLGAAYALALHLAGLPRRRREAAVVPVTALAVVEDLRALGGEVTSEVRVEFDLTVAPDDAPAHRVEFTRSVNLVDLPGYRPRDILVVRYPPDRPWRVEIVKRPAPAWADRAAAARIDSAPAATRVGEPTAGCLAGLALLLGVLLGAACVVLPSRADLFGEDPAARPSATAAPSALPSVSSTASTTVVSSASATVALGPGQSFLDRGALRRAVDSATRGKGAAERRALTVVVQDRVLSVVFVPAGTRALGFDPRTLPYDRLPALVAEARTTLGVRSPRTWQLTADGLSGSLTLRVGVTGPDGAASLEADGEATVVRRDPAR